MTEATIQKDFIENELNHKNDLNGKDSSKTSSNKILNPTCSLAEGGNYWQLRYEKLLDDYNKLHEKNQNLEEKLLNVVELFEKKKEELIANVEYEKSTLMADVNKLSTKLVDARIKLHDYEEKELIHASECSAPCHKNCHDRSQQIDSTGTRRLKDNSINTFDDPNLV